MYENCLYIWTQQASDYWRLNDGQLLLYIKENQGRFEVSKHPRKSHFSDQRNNVECPIFIEESIHFDTPDPIYGRLMVSRAVARRSFIFGNRTKDTERTEIKSQFGKVCINLPPLINCTLRLPI